MPNRNLAEQGAVGTPESKISFEPPFASESYSHTIHGIVPEKVISHIDMQIAGEARRVCKIEL